MMKSLLSFMIFCVTLGYHSGEPIPEISQKEVDLGAFDGDSIQTADFTVRNIGSDTLVIYNIYTGCRCTRPSGYTNIIAPGDSTTLTVTYNGKGNVPGRIRQRITLRTNAAKPYQSVHLIGEIRRPIRK